MYQVVQKYLTSVGSAEHLVKAEVKAEAKRPEEGGAESGAGWVRVSRSRTCGHTMIITHHSPHSLFTDTICHNSIVIICTDQNILLQTLHIHKQKLNLNVRFWMK